MRAADGDASVRGTQPTIPCGRSVPPNLRPSALPTVVPEAPPIGAASAAAVRPPAWIAAVRSPGRSRTHLRRRMASQHIAEIRTPADRRDPSAKANRPAGIPYASVPRSFASVRNANPSAGGGRSARKWPHAVKAAVGALLRDRTVVAVEAQVAMVVGAGRAEAGAAVNVIQFSPSVVSSIRAALLRGPFFTQNAALRWDPVPPPSSPDSSRRRRQSSSRTTPTTTTAGR